MVLSALPMSLQFLQNHLYIRNPQNKNQLLSLSGYVAFIKKYDIYLQYK